MTQFAAVMALAGVLALAIAVLVAAAWSAIVGRWGWHDHRCDDCAGLCPPDACIGITIDPDDAPTITVVTFEQWRADALRRRPPLNPDSPFGHEVDQ